MKINGPPWKYLFLRILGKPILFSSLTLLVFTLTVFASELKEAEPKRVLVIYSYHEGLLWERLIDDSLRATLAAKSTEPIDLKVEHTDRVSYPDDAYLHKLVDLYRRKYSDPKMDLVIGIDDEATEILLRYGEELFPGVPMVFVTAERKDLQRDSLKPNMTSLFWGVDIKGTVELIQQVLPKTGHLFIISGSSLSDQAVNGLARKVIEGYTNRLDINYLTDITIEDLLQRVAKLPENSAVIYLAFSRDAEGKSFVPREILSVISEKANAPLFGIVGTYHGQGIVGGSLLSPEIQGKRCAEIGLLILGGESPVDIVPEKTLNVSVFDWRQLKRWGISAEKLPAGSIIRFRELSLWKEHKSGIIGAAVLIVAQALLISILLIQRARRRQVERSLVEAESNYRTVADFTYDWEYWASLDGTLRYVSPSCERISGYKVKDFIENPNLLSEIITPEDKDVWDQHYHDSKNERSSREIQFRIRTRTGEIRWIEHACQPVTDENDKVLGFRASNRDITVRKKQGIEIQNRLEFEAFIADLSSEFINLSADKFDSKIDDVLSQIGTFMNVERSFIFQFNLNKTEFRISHLWEAEGIQKDQVVRGVIVRDHFPWLAVNLLADRDIVISDVEDLLSEDSHREYAYCRKMGIQSFIILPIKVKDAALCAIGLDSIRTKKQWSEETKTRLRTIGEIFANTIARKHSELGLQNAYGEIKLLNDRLEAESSYLQEEIKLDHNFENIIGESEPLKYVLYRVEQVAPTDSPVLIMGETGTGKELIARSIHRLSLRKEMTLVKVNCAALPTDLIESELFGREKGAFTGATKTQIGRFELANGSTLLLDEIGEMPLELQAKLLRVLESGEFERLGNPKNLHSDARIIATTNRNLEEAVREKRFRQDLWYRLKVFPITIPPLRQRKEDIPSLIQWFVVQYSRKMGIPPVKITKGTLEALQAYDWPGNVRELKHATETAVITARGQKLRFDLPKRPDDFVKGFISFEEMERDFILQVLKEKNWKIQGTNSAAAVLKMHPNTLRARIKKLGLKRPS